MEICVERDANARFGSGMLQDVDIISAAQSDLGHMDHVPANLNKQSGGRPRQALIEQQAFHTASSGCTLSSRFRAANSSAWRISSGSSSGYSRRRSSQFG